MKKNSSGKIKLTPPTPVNISGPSESARVRTPRRWPAGVERTADAGRPARWHLRKPTSGRPSICATAASSSGSRRRGSQRTRHRAYQEHRQSGLPTLVAHEPRHVPGLPRALTVRTIHESLAVDVCQPDDHRLPASAAVYPDFVVVHSRRGGKNPADGRTSTFLSVLSVHHFRRYEEPFQKCPTRHPRRHCQLGCPFPPSAPDSEPLTGGYAMMRPSGSMSVHPRAGSEAPPHLT
jgi:hypothetical protein